MPNNALAGNGVRTNNGELVMNAFKFAVGASGAVGTLTQNTGAMVSGVALTGGAGAGTYTVTLAKPLPVNMLACAAQLARVAVTSTTGSVAYKANSYDPVAGTFVLLHSIPAGAGAATTQVAADPVNGSEITCVYWFTDTYAYAGL